MAIHDRVGADSPVNLLSRYLFEDIFSYLRPQEFIGHPETIEDYKRIYEQQKK